MIFFSFPRICDTYKRASIHILVNFSLKLHHHSLNDITYSEYPYWKGRHGMVDLIELTSLLQLIFILNILFNFFTN